MVLGVFALASYFAISFGSAGLWRGLEAAHAVATPGKPTGPYDLTQLVAVNETLNTIRTKYVDPSRVKPRQMFLSALDEVQKEVAQVIVLHEEKSPTVKVRVATKDMDFRVDNVQGPWDVAARLREVFAFLQANLKNTEVELRDVEYAACNGMLRTLDPHSVFMSPEAYKEMNLSTSGHFGGLGIVISIRDQMLTVMKPMPDTPAGRANLKRLDRITKINNESTLNMPLDDAVQRLRGKPGSKVTIWVHREGPDGWNGSRPFELTREQIQIRSIESKNLGDGIGYIRIKQFQASTADELDRALTSLRKGGHLAGLVLDLRMNPGGLLDQAAKVADRFLDKGVIVSTVGASEGRDEKTATARGTEPDYPIAVLVNGASASASEIVAGALKNLDRAVIVGQSTFGKGTVQLVFPRITPDGAALKLTIAQYLTPGDTSIQGVGVAPDIELDPMTADMLEMDLFRSEHALRERDLSKSLAHNGERRADRPTYKLRYNLPESERAKIRELGGDLDDEFQMDFPISFARDLAKKLSPATREKQLKEAKPFVASEQASEIASISRDLEQLGIDWSEPPANYSGGPSAKDFAVKVTTDKPKDDVDAGESMKLKVTLTNQSKATAYQVRAITKSDAPYFDEKELLFGKIEPGQSKTAEAPLGWCDIEGRAPGSTAPLPTDAKRVCELPKDAVTRQEIVKVRFFAEGSDAPADAEIRPTIHSLPQPVFAYSYQVADNRPGNGDGQLTRGEGATVYMTVKNVGKGPSLETQANLRNLTGDGILLRAGRFDVSNMKPGDVRNVEFTFDVLDNLPENLVKVELSVSDRDLRVVSREKLTMPVTRGGLNINEDKGVLKLSGRAGVRAQPMGASAVVGHLPEGSLVEKEGRFGDFDKVSLGGSRFGFIESKLTVPAQGRPGDLKYEPELTRSPPLLEVKPAQLATRSKTVEIEGKAMDVDQVMDAYIFVGTRKVFYRANQGPNKTEMTFKVTAELQPGVNMITVVARENEDTATRHTMVVRRDGPNGEPLPTPKTDVFGSDWEFIQGE